MPIQKIKEYYPVKDKDDKNKGPIKKIGKPKREAPIYEMNSNWWGKRKPKPSKDVEGSWANPEESTIEMTKSPKWPRNDDSNGKKRQTDFEIMQRQKDFDESNILLNRIIDEEQEEGSSLMRMGAMRLHQARGSYDGIDDTIKDMANSDKKSMFSKMIKRMSKAFNSSFEDPISRLFVAIALGLITTLGVYAVISMIKTIIMGENEFKYEHGKKENRQVPHQYTPIPMYPN